MLKAISIFTLLASSSLAVIDTGTGADGVCNWAANQPSGTYNCTTLTVTGTVGFTGPTATPVVIKVQGDVNINGTLTVAGQVNGTRGPGGYPGGAINGGAGSAPGAAPTAAGAGGSAAGLTPNEPIGGGGGQGGSHSTLGADGAAGTDPVTGTADTPGAGGTGASVTYGSEVNFETTFLGGSGGGGGNRGAEPFDASMDDGGTGGGGGGAIRISAGGVINIAGTINANGGNGAPGVYGADDNGPGGGGGGGAGGAVFLQAVDTITISGSITANGGSGGVGGNSAAANADGSGGNGGAGGIGRIRLDSESQIIGASNVSPTPLVFANGTSPLFFESDISPGCVIRENHFEKPFQILVCFFVLLNLALFGLLNIKKIKKVYT